jgi:hypothetical protein
MIVMYPFVGPSYEIFVLNDVILIATVGTGREFATTTTPKSAMRVIIETTSFLSNLAPPGIDGRRSRI